MSCPLSCPLSSDLRPGLAKMSAGQPAAVPWNCIFEDCTGTLPLTPPNLKLCPFCTREQTQKPKPAPEPGKPSCRKCGAEFIIAEQPACHMCGTKVTPDNPPPASSDETENGYEIINTPSKSSGESAVDLPR